MSRFHKKFFVFDGFVYNINKKPPRIVKKITACFKKRNM